MPMELCSFVNCLSTSTCRRAHDCISVDKSRQMQCWCLHADKHCSICAYTKHAYAGCTHAHQTNMGRNRRGSLFYLTFCYAVLLAGAGCRAASSMALEAHTAKDDEFLVLRLRELWALGEEGTGFEISSAAGSWCLQKPGHSGGCTSRLHTSRLSIEGLSGVEKLNLPVLLSRGVYSSPFWSPTYVP